MTAALTPQERRRIFAGCCEHSDLWHDGHGCLCCGCKDSRTADDVFERPPWCGTCDEWTRKVEVEIEGRDAMQNCARCHPLAVAS